MTTKDWLERRMPRWFLDKYRVLKYRHGFKRGRRTWSQEGEDMILRRMFNKCDGFYVDIGAHHPYRYSNTFYLYRLGWRGINVDASPETIRLFEHARPEDLNLNVGVSRSGGMMRYFQFNDAAYNTFDENLASHVRESMQHVRLLCETEVKTMSLEDLLSERLLPGTRIDLMNIDVEGMDMEVLESNNWSRHRPVVVLVEVLWKSIEDILQCPVYRLLSANGYQLYAKCVNTVVYKDSQNGL